MKVSSRFALLILAALSTSVCAADEPMADEASAKAAIAHQLKLLTAGDVDQLKPCFTPRLRDRITADAVKQGQQEIAKHTLDDLVSSVQLGDDEGRKTAKIKMQNGRTLTTLVWQDKGWLADTIWFR